MRQIVVALIRVYRYAVSPFLGQSCRFYPSCSHYAVEAVQRHGVIRGGGLAIARIGRCHPFHPGGYDPVPGADAAEAAAGAERPSEPPSQWGRA